MPGRKWYAVSALVFVLGAVGCAMLLFIRLSDLSTALQQVVVPGERAVMLDEPGSYTVYHEADSVVDGQLYSVSDVGGLRVLLVPDDGDGEAVALEPTTIDSSYSISGRTGRAILSAEIPQPGRYRLSASYPDNRDGPPTVLAIGRGIASRIVMTILAALGLGVTTTFVAMAIAGVTFWKRYRASHA